MARTRANRRHRRRRGHRDRAHHHRSASGQQSHVPTNEPPPQVYGPPPQVCGPPLLPAYGPPPPEVYGQPAQAYVLPHLHPHGEPLIRAPRRPIPQAYIPPATPCAPFSRVDRVLQELRDRDGGPIYFTLTEKELQKVIERAPKGVNCISWPEVTRPKIQAPEKRNNEMLELCRKAGEPEES
ncbi:HET domain-containing protein [Fusarium sp. LHS14.1]|nr:HET domain-containing protein [Fusarium sp. LHS14.1]